MKKLLRLASLAILVSFVIFSCNKEEPIKEDINLKIVAVTITPITDKDLAKYSEGTMNPDNISYEEFQEIKKSNGVFPVSEYESRLNSDKNNQNRLKATCTPNCGPWRIAWSGNCRPGGSCSSKKIIGRIYGRTCKRSDCTTYYYESAISYSCC